MVGTQNQHGAEQQDADDDDVAQKLAHRRSHVDATIDIDTQAGELAILLAEMAVEEVDGGVGLDDFQSHQRLLHHGRQARAALLQLDGVAPQTACDAADDKDDQRQHEQHKACQLDVDIDQHQQEEEHAHHRVDKGLEGIDDVLLVLDHVAAETREDVALAVSDVIADGQTQCFCIQVVAYLLQNAAPQPRHRHRGEVAEEVFQRVGDQDEQREIDQRLASAVDDELPVEPVERLGHQVAGGGGAAHAVVVEQQLQEVSHTQGRGNGENHAQRCQRDKKQHPCPMPFESVDGKLHSP